MGAIIVKQLACWALVIIMMLAFTALAEEVAQIVDDSDGYVPTGHDPFWRDKGIYRLFDAMPIVIDDLQKEFTLELWVTDYSETNGYPPPPLPTLEYAFIIDNGRFVQQMSVDIEEWARTDVFLKYMDVNFDGYRDLLFCKDHRTLDGYQYWLWNQAEGKFVMSESFTAMASHPVFYPETKRIGCYEGLSADTYVHGYLYEVVGDTVVLIKEVEKTSDGIQTIWWSDIESLLWDD
jgi:hypothetical protein